MPTPISLHHLGVDYGSEATIVAWHVAVGTEVAEGETIAEVETSKASHDVVAPVAGTLARIDAQVSVQWSLDDPIGWIIAPGESVDDLPPTRGAADLADTPDGGRTPS